MMTGSSMSRKVVGRSTRTLYTVRTLKMAASQFLTRAQSINLLVLGSRMPVREALCMNSPTCVHYEVSVYTLGLICAIGCL